jgi:hypothetical protein
VSKRKKSDESVGWDLGVDKSSKLEEGKWESCFEILNVYRMYAMAYLLKYLRRGLRAGTPSIILCVKTQRTWSLQRRGISHSGG